jgi:hypothetical protein
MGGGPAAGRVALNTNLIDDRKECAMKLTSAQVERTLTQFQGEAIPDNHPVVPQLNSLFGEHTFFLDSHGLNIAEPAEAAGSGAQLAKVVNVANWSDANRNRLEPHEPHSAVPSPYGRCWHFATGTIPLNLCPLSERSGNAGRVASTAPVVVTQLGD